MGDGRLVAAPFLVKTYRLVDDPSSDNIISWGEQNKTFVVWRPKDLSTFLLPHYFNHNNFSSFVRQLNTYGFRKIARGRYEFGNELFKKGHQHLLCHIQRRKLPIRSQGMSMSMSIQQVSSEPPVESLSEENERLREKNMVLSSEIVRLRSICKGMLSFVRHNNSSNTNTDLVLQTMRQQNSPQHDSSPPKLFGVPLSRQIPPLYNMANL